MVFESINKIWAQPLRYGLFTFFHGFWIILQTLKFTAKFWSEEYFGFWLAFAIQSIYRRLLN